MIFPSGKGTDKIIMIDIPGYYIMPDKKIKTTLKYVFL